MFTRDSWAEKNGSMCILCKGADGKIALQTTISDVLDTINMVMSKSFGCTNDLKAKCSECLPSSLENHTLYGENSPMK